MVLGGDHVPRRLFRPCCGRQFVIETPRGDRPSRRREERFLRLWKILRELLSDGVGREREKSRLVDDDFLRKCGRRGVAKQFVKRTPGGRRKAAT
jgi:hypothetical protein